MRRLLLLLTLPALLVGCPEPEPEPEPTPPPVTETAFAGTVVDRQGGDPLEECLVGVTPDDAVETDEDGAFAIVVGLGATVHVACEGRPVWSATLPEIAAAEWTIGIDGGAPPADWCPISLSYDGSAVDGAGGRLELRVLNATDTASLGLTFQSGLTVEGVFAVPPGDFKVLGRAHGGDEAGFGITDVQTCTGGETAAVALTIEPVATRELSGTWSPTSSDVDLSVTATQPLDDADFGWWEQDVAHAGSGNPVGWSLTVAEGIGTGPLDLEACQSRGDEHACRGRLDVDDSGGSIDLGELVEPVSPAASVDAGGIDVSIPFDVTSGHTVVRVDDFTDPLAIETVWRAVVADGASATVDAAWFDALDGSDYLVRVFAIDGSVIDWAASPEPIDFTDGYAYQAPGLLEIEAD